MQAWMQCMVTTEPWSHGRSVWMWCVLRMYGQQRTRSCFQEALTKVLPSDFAIRAKFLEISKLPSESVVCSDIKSVNDLSWLVSRVPLWSVYFRSAVILRKSNGYVAITFAGSKSKGRLESVSLIKAIKIYLKIKMQYFLDSRSHQCELIWFLRNLMNSISQRECGKRGSM